MHPYSELPDAGMVLEILITKTRGKSHGGRAQNDPRKETSEVLKGPLGLLFLLLHEGE